MYMGAHATMYVGAHATIRVLWHSNYEQVWRHFPAHRQEYKGVVESALVAWRRPTGAACGGVVGLLNVIARRDGVPSIKLVKVGKTPGVSSDTYLVLEVWPPEICDCLAGNANGFFIPWFLHLDSRFSRREIGREILLDLVGVAGTWQDLVGLVRTR